MDKSVGLLAYPSLNLKFSQAPQHILGRSNSEKEYGPDLANKIDICVQDIVCRAYERAKEVITTNKHLLMQLSDELFIKELLSNKEIEQILGKRPDGALTVSHVLDIHDQPESNKPSVVHETVK
uniref:ATP-dependent zinc metalloprotease FtsH (Trinotate prediction) n=1 Tax=Henneguya salminicola TaxID=69463 RepID=A0A6G3MM45_HENSL